MVAELERSAEDGATARVASRTVVRATAGAREWLGEYDESQQAQNCAVEYSADVPVPQIIETGRVKRVSGKNKEQVDVLTRGEKMQERTVEEIIYIPALGVLGESIEAVKHFPGEQVQSYTVEQTIDSRISHVKEEINEAVKHVPQEQVQCIGKTADVSIVRQVPVPTVQAVRKTVAVPQTQFPVRVPDDTVLTPGTIVQSELCNGGGDKPRARCVQIGASNVAESRSVLGRVKSVRDKHCFVTSDCVEGDIFLAKEEISDEWSFLQVGVPLRFRLVPGSDKLKACSAKMLVMNFRNAPAKSYSPGSHYFSFSCDRLDEGVWNGEAAFARRQLTMCPGEEDSSTIDELKSPARGAPAQAECFKGRCHVCLTAQTKEQPRDPALDHTYQEHQEGNCAKQEQNLAERRIWYRFEGRSRLAEVRPGKGAEAEENAKKDLGITSRDQIYLVAGGKVVS